MLTLLATRCHGRQPRTQRRSRDALGGNRPLDHQGRDHWEKRHRSDTNDDTTRSGRALCARPEHGDTREGTDRTAKPGLRTGRWLVRLPQCLARLELRTCGLRAAARATILRNLRVDPRPSSSPASRARPHDRGHAVAYQLSESFAVRHLVRRGGHDVRRPPVMSSVAGAMLTAPQRRNRRW